MRLNVNWRLKEDWDLAEFVPICVLYSRKSLKNLTFDQRMHIQLEFQNSSREMIKAFSFKLHFTFSYMIQLTCMYCTEIPTFFFILEQPLTRVNFAKEMPQPQFIVNHF